MFAVRLTLAMSAISIVAHPASGGDMPTFRDAVSAYTENVKQLLPASFEWTVEYQEFSAAFDTDLLNLPVYRGYLENGQVRQEDAPTLNGWIRSAESRVSPEAQAARLRPTVQRQFVWTDGVRFQFRKPQNQVDLATVLDRGLPNPSAATLQQSFPASVVYSYDPIRVPRLRKWVGITDGDGAGWGQVASQDMTELFSLKFPAGFPVREPLDPARNLSPIDTCLSTHPQVEQTIQAEDLAGESTLRVQIAVGGGKGGRVDRYTLDLAATKALFPLRIEHSYSGGNVSVEPESGYPRAQFKTSSGPTARKPSESIPYSVPASFRSG